MSDFRLGRHEAMIESLDARMTRVETMVGGVDKKVDAVLTQLAERRGERRTIAAVATLAGGIGSFIMSLFLKSGA